MNYYNVGIYLKNNNDAEMLGITKELLKPHIYKRFQTGDGGRAEVVIKRENVFFLLKLLVFELLSTSEFKIPFFFFGKS